MMWLSLEEEEETDENIMFLGEKTMLLGENVMFLGGTVMCPCTSGNEGAAPVVRARRVSIGSSDGNMLLLRR